MNYALKNDALILYDAAYQAYIQDPDIPHSIYEIRGARKCAVEFRSFSKTAGFTGVRCGYTIVPKDVSVSTFEGERISLNQLWLRRQCTKFNGTSYISQRAAEAIYSPEGKQQVQQTIDYYMQNAARMLSVLRSLGFECYGGENAPLHLDAHALRPSFMAVLRGAALRSQCGLHPWCRLRTLGRGLCALYRLWQSRAHRGGPADESKWKNNI